MLRPKLMLLLLLLIVRLRIYLGSYGESQCTLLRKDVWECKCASSVGRKTPDIHSRYARGREWERERGRRVRAVLPPFTAVTVNFPTNMHFFHDLIHMHLQ